MQVLPPISKLVIMKGSTEDLRYFRIHIWVYEPILDPNLVGVLFQERIRPGGTTFRFRDPDISQRIECQFMIHLL